jgi:hypothetical protein
MTLDLDPQAASLCPDECAHLHLPMDLITDHPYQPSEWGDICAQEINGWPCGYSRAEHTDPGADR